MSDSTATDISRDETSGPASEAPASTPAKPTRKRSKAEIQSPTGPGPAPEGHEPDETDRPGPTRKARPGRRPKVADVHKAIDDFRYYRDFHEAMINSAVYSRNRRFAVTLGPPGPRRKGDPVPVLEPDEIPFIPEDFPERFRANWDPEFDRFEESIELAACDAADELADAIRGHSQAPGPFHTFLDERDSLRWLALPAGFLFHGPEGGWGKRGRYMPGDKARSTYGQTFAFKADHEILIPADWISYEKPRGKWAIDATGRAELRA